MQRPADVQVLELPQLPQVFPQPSEPHCLPEQFGSHMQVPSLRHVSLLGQSLFVQHSAAQWSSHFKPTQRKSQLEPSQVATPFVGLGHGRHELPQVAVLALSAQMPLQSCLSASHLP
jgi:hypothetical protein